MTDAEIINEAFDIAAGFWGLEGAVDNGDDSMDDQYAGDQLCDHRVVVRTRECSSVCLSCGFVLDLQCVDYSRAGSTKDKFGRHKDVYSGYEPVLAPMYTRSSTKSLGSYERKFHLNERIAQLCLQEPGIPDPFKKLIQDSFTGLARDKQVPANADDLSKDDVRTVCRAIIVPEELAEKYRSKKFLMRPHVDCIRYAEKWISIKRMLGGKPPPRLTFETHAAIIDDWARLSIPFEYFRHVPGCNKPGKKCHKMFGCRHNFPNYNYLLLQVFIRNNKHVEFGPWIPQLRTPKKLKEIDNLVGRMFKYLGWKRVKIARLVRRLRRGWNPKVTGEEQDDKEVVEKEVAIAIRDGYKMANQTGKKTK